LFHVQLKFFGTILAILLFLYSVGQNNKWNISLKQQMLVNA